MSPKPQLTVIIPAHNALATVRRALEGIVASDFPRERYELVLVDDGSTDETSVVAAEYCDVVVRLSGNPHGPAYARNRGCEASRGGIITFVDADVVVHPDALRRVAAHFDADPGLSAVFGSYDHSPPAPGLVSQYRNLLHHYVHQLGRGPAETFWAGLGAVRREAFEAVGRFDEWHYARPQIEDIELGRRLRRTGYTVQLDPDIQGTHLKRWTLLNTFLSDLQHRGVPWMWLILQEGPTADTRVLNIRTRETALTALAGISLGLLVAAVALPSAELAFATAACYLVILAANVPFYRFLMKVRGLGFALAALPLHLGYYAVNAVSVVLGWLVHVLFGEPIPPPIVSAHAQIGIETWPPPPRRSDQSIWEPQLREAIAMIPESTTLPADLQLAFEPLHKRAFGFAMGIASGLLCFGMTALVLVRHSQGDVDLSILAEYFYGYTVSWPGALVALAWGFVAGFVAGWFAAFCRNFALAGSLWLGRTRSELEDTRDFLDHI